MRVSYNNIEYNIGLREEAIQQLIEKIIGARIERQGRRISLDSRINNAALVIEILRICGLIIKETAIYRIALNGTPQDRIEVPKSAKLLLIEGGLSTETPSATHNNIEEVELKCAITGGILLQCFLAQMFPRLKRIIFHDYEFSNEEEMKCIGGIYEIGGKYSVRKAAYSCKLMKIEDMAALMAASPHSVCIEDYNICTKELAAFTQKCESVKLIKFADQLKTIPAIFDFKRIAELFPALGEYEFGGQFISLGQMRDILEKKVRGKVEVD